MHEPRWLPSTNTAKALDGKARLRSASMHLLVKMDKYRTAKSRQISALFEQEKQNFRRQRGTNRTGMQLTWRVPPHWETLLSAPSK